MKDTQLITVKELSERIKLSVSHIYRLRKKKAIPFVVIGGKILFNSDKINEWIDKNSSY